ncbi:hypothetical protein RJT34_20638 [Clitoria ternatea]|uniref:PPC domain-containing protein n=1 Tax=Clitoria ternatea TaxID=43366 RepID=A0AAN9IT62_CLITE
MANRWWTESVALGGPVIDASSPMKKPDLGFSINDTVSPATANQDEKDSNSEEPKEEVLSTTRRPRGRPAGSKNKPKPPIFVTRDSPNVLRSHVMEVANGADIADSLMHFARRRQRGVCVLSATGNVVNVTLRQPSGPGGVIALQGQFEIISMTGSFLPGPPSPSGLTVYMAGGQGQVVGGGVVGPLVASGTVMVMVATFSNAVYERLPIDDDDEEGSSSNPVYDSGVPNPNVPQPQPQQLNHHPFNSPWSLAAHPRPPFN